MKWPLPGAIGLMVAALLVAPLAGQAPQVFTSIDVRAPIRPRPFVGGGGTHLVYELHVSNLLPRLTTIEAVEVMDGSRAADGRVLLRLEREALEAALFLPGGTAADKDKRMLPAGRTAIVFVWVTLQTGAIPTSLTHRFTLRIAHPATSTPQTSATEETAVTVSGVAVAVSPMSAPVIGPPLEGDLWLAANGPDNGVGHRRTLLALAGQGRIAQRFATDWVRLFDDGRTFRGDPSDNASYRAFGARVLAVAGGTVLEMVDGLPENVPDPVARAVPITPATIGGNYILLDLGNGVYATYAHLQPGSLKVKKGDRVRKGQALALVGNTGNSSEPHLHFHLTDAPRPFDAEGIPYAIDSFELQAGPSQVTRALREVGASLGFDPAALGAWLRVPAGRREKELPLLNAVVTFATPPSGR